MPHIRVENLTLIKDKKTIFSDISFCVERGEILGILGANGAGKTSLLRSCAGLIKATKGKIFLQGKELARYSAKSRAQTISFLEQGHESDTNIKARHVVELGRLPYKPLFSFWQDSDEAAIISALEKVDMRSKAMQKWHQLSGGEKQRLHIARALAQQTEILLLDEPTNHLDIHYQLELLALLQGFPWTILCSLHDLNHAANFCQRLLLLKQGKIYAQGTPKEMLTPQNIYDVFGVSCRIIEDENGFYIRFLKA